jgi:hypothetical protein
MGDNILMEKLNKVIFYLLDEEDTLFYLNKLDEFLGLPNENTKEYTKPYLSCVDNTLYIISIEHEELKYENIIGDIIEEYSYSQLKELGHIPSYNI